MKPPRTTAPLSVSATSRVPETMAENAEAPLAMNPLPPESTVMPLAVAP
jgi:hypothetical protein